MGNSSRLADSTANQILKMIEEEERFSHDKSLTKTILVAELEWSCSKFSEKQQLATYGILEIKRQRAHL